MYQGPLRCQKLSVQATSPLFPLQQCAHCYSPLKTPLRCSACRQTYYCSQHCQEQHWKQPNGHRATCALKLSAIDLIKFQLKQQNIEFLEDNLYAFVFAPAIDQMLIPLPYKQYKGEQGRFIAHIQQKINVVNGEQRSIILVESFQNIYAANLGDEICTRDLRTSGNYLFDGIKLICSGCRGPVSIDNGKCLKCSLENTISDVQKAVLSELNALKDVQDKQNVTKKMTWILKQNALHHLAFATYEPMCQIFQQLMTVNKSIFAHAVQLMLDPIDIYSLSFCFVKINVQHFGMFSSVCYSNLRKVCEILNLYTMNELEAAGCPPLLQEHNERMDPIPAHEVQRMREIAAKLLTGHRNCLDFCSQLKELSEKMKDEKIMQECDKLAGAVECRVENLESWVEGYEDADEELIVKGTEYNGETAKNVTDVL